MFAIIMILAFTIDNKCLSAPVSVIPNHGMTQGGNIVFVDIGEVPDNPQTLPVSTQFGDSPPVMCEFNVKTHTYLCEVPPHPIPESVNITIYIDNKKFSMGQIYTYTSHGKQDAPILKIHTKTLQSNIKMVKNLIPPNVLFGAVLKNGDPVGLLGKAFEDAVRVDYFCVPKLQDGIELREAGVKAPIMLLYLEQPENIPVMLYYDIEPAATSINWVKQAEQILSKTKSKLNVHLWVDTGLGREGVMPDEALPLARLIHESSSLVLKGIATHFCCIGPDDLSDIKKKNLRNETVAQKHRFDQVVQTLHSQGIGLEAIIHAGASDVVRYNLKPLYYDLLRIGSLLFENKSGQDHNYSWITRIEQVKTLPRHWCIDYGCENRTKKATRAGLLSHIPSRDDGHMFYIRGKKAEVLLDHGTDGLIVLDISHMPNIQEGEEVNIDFDPSIYSPLDSTLPLPVALQK